MSISFHEQKISLLKLLCDRAGCYDKFEELEEDMIIEDMLDGGMGSFTIKHVKVQEVEHTLLEAQYIDEDKIPVFIALLADANGYPSEIDLFKGDFSKIIEYPTANKIFNIE